MSIRSKIATAVSNPLFLVRGLIRCRHIGICNCQIGLILVAFFLTEIDVHFVNGWCNSLMVLYILKIVSIRGELR